MRWLKDTEIDKGQEKIAVLKGTMPEWEFLFFFLSKTEFQIYMLPDYLPLALQRQIGLERERTFCVLPHGLVTWKHTGTGAVCREVVNLRVRKDTSNPLPQAEAEMVFRKRFRGKNVFHIEKCMLLLREVWIFHK